MTRKRTVGGWLAAVILMLVPAVTQAGPGAVYFQEHFRWRNDNGDASTATWKAAADVVPTNVPHYQNVRLRFSISNQGQGYGNFWCNFEYATATNGPWAPVAPSSGGAFPFEFSDSTWFTNKAPAGNLLPGTGAFTNHGEMVELDGGNIDVGVAFDPSTYINTELCFRPTAKARGGVTYYFRLNPMSSAIACSQYAALTMEAYDPPEAPKIVSPLSGVTVLVERVGYGQSDRPDAPYPILASGSEPITYEAQNLPAGYRLFGNTIADDGTPLTPGTHSVTLTVRNAYGSDTKTLSLTVADRQVPVYRTLLSGEVGKPFRFEAPVAGTAPIGCRLEVVGGGSLPAGLSFDGVRTISGTPQAAGTSKLWIAATNAANAASGGPKCCVILTITGGGGVADADGDGMPDAWEIQYFGSTNAPNGAASADADGDGMNNLAEFKAGTIPTDSGSVLAVGGTTLGSGDQLVVAWPSVSGKSYGVEKRTNLVGGGWQPAAGGIPGHPPVNTYTDNIGSIAAGFYRVKVE